MPQALHNFVSLCQTIQTSITAWSLWRYDWITTTQTFSTTKKTTNRPDMAWQLYMMNGCIHFQAIRRVPFWQTIVGARAGCNRHCDQFYSILSIGLRRPRTDVGKPATMGWRKRCQCESRESTNDMMGPAVFMAVASSKQSCYKCIIHMSQPVPKDRVVVLHTWSKATANPVQDKQPALGSLWKPSNRLPVTRWVLSSTFVCGIDKRATPTPQTTPCST